VTVSLASASSAFSVPASVVVPQGSTTASFTITTDKALLTASGTLSASYAGVTRTTVFTVTPRAISAIVCRTEEPFGATAAAQSAQPVRAVRAAPRQVVRPVKSQRAK
jgi:hypothetical protein